MSTRRIARRRHKKDYAAHAAATALLSGVPPPAPSLEVFEFLPRLDAPPTRRKPGTARLPKALREAADLGTLQHPGFVQRENIPQSIVPGASALATLLSAPGTAASELELDDDMQEFLAPSYFDPEEEGVVMGRPQSSHHRARRAAQHATWRDTVIPQLLDPFLRFLHGQPASSTRPLDCPCSGRKTVTIALADWEGITEQSLLVCRCAPASAQLVRRGFFPCAPKRPSMAFSIRLLEFISLHSLYVAPNNTAWATTLEAFWARRGFIVEEARAFRKRLGNTVQWFQVLVNYKDAKIKSGLDAARQTLRTKRRRDGDADCSSPRASKRARSDDVQPKSPIQPDLSAAAEAVLETPAGDTAAARHNEPVVGQVEDSVPTPRTRNQHRQQQNAKDDAGKRDSAANGQDTASNEPATAAGSSSSCNQQRTRPSDYLRSRCPLCFGGVRPDFKLSNAHVIVCLDANFAQKRRKSKDTDPVLVFSGGRFVPAAEVEAMEREVDSKRKRPAKRRTTGTSASLDDDVLDECESSFIAAQEKVTKASKNYYADTGLMALLCRHDRVLYLANLTSPGERQHYALVLLRKLFEGLPSDWNVGTLYDIACQLSRSIEKHDLLEDFAERLVFGVSVFHAYGHQWACQLVFHPRKRDGFGLTDGEGCERFWSSIRHLIACLRVSGFWRRQFVLDRQINFLDEQNLSKIGRWLSKRWADTAQRLLAAERQLELCGVPETVLRAQWSAQITAQLAKAPRQSKHAGDKQIDKILLDLGYIDDLKQQVVDERAKLKAGVHRLTAKDVEAITTAIDQSTREIKAVRSRIAVAQSQLGTGAIRKFEELRGDAYVRARVNARALRVNIRMAVQAHKFEREKLERDYRRQVMQNKDHAQTRDLVHSRERNITVLVKKFNAQVNHMAQLVRDNLGPRRKMAIPRALDAKKLFRLDVDDDIWQEDPGLGPQDEGELPRWQVDENVRKGIRFMLDVARCREERERLLVEAKALRAWWTEECRVLRHFSTSLTVNKLWQSEAAVQLRRLTHFARLWNKALASASFTVTFDSADNPVIDSKLLAQWEAAALGRVPPDVTADDAPLRADVAADDSDTLAEDSGSEGSFYMSGDSITDAGEDEHDALLLDMATAAFSDVEGDGNEDKQHHGASDSLSAPSRLTLTSDSTSARAAEGAAMEIPRASSSRAAAPSSAADGTQAAGQLESNFIEISSSDSDDSAPPPVRRRARERGRACGPYCCDNEDIARMASRTAWLSGTGLAVYAESRLRAAAVPSVGHCPSTLLVDVRDYMIAKANKDDVKLGLNRGYVWAHLKALPEPGAASKWLVVVHIEDPEHWTLVAICWRSRELRFYDSLSATNSYDLLVKERIKVFLELCEQFYKRNLAISQWTWIGEKRPVRQSNWFDCGPFVAADFVSLLTSEEPSTLREADMAVWRRQMLEHMRTLPEHRSKGKGGPLTGEQLASVESIHDDD